MSSMLQVIIEIRKRAVLTPYRRLPGRPSANPLHYKDIAGLTGSLSALIGFCAYAQALFSRTEREPPMTDTDIDGIAEAAELRLVPRFEAIDGRLNSLADRVTGLEGRITTAIVTLADAIPGSVPGVKSYAQKQVERALDGGE